MVSSNECIYSGVRCKKDGTPYRNNRYNSYINLSSNDAVLVDIKEQCDSCVKWFNKEDLIYGPSPFAQDVYGDDTKLWLCLDCHQASCDDI